MTERAMISPKKLSLEKALHLLRKPDVRLVRLHSNNGGAGFYIWPDGGRVPDDVAHLLLERNDVQPNHSGFFPATHRAGVSAIGEGRDLLKKWAATYGGSAS